MEQLGAIVGDEVRDAGMRAYVQEWSFKHPGPHDFKRVLERTSGLELDWYFQYMMHTTDAVDYAVESVINAEGKVVVELGRRGDMPMPQDLTLTWEDGSTTKVHIPLVMMRGHRPLGEQEVLGADCPGWTPPTPWKCRQRKLTRVELDAKGRLADIHRDNNALTFNLKRKQKRNSPTDKSSHVSQLDPLAVAVVGRCPSDRIGHRSSLLVVATSLDVSGGPSHHPPKLDGRAVGRLVGMESWHPRCGPLPRGGGVGAPVFAEGASGWQHFTGSTSGFLLAFPIGALVVGWLGERIQKMRYATSALLLLLGQSIVVVLGLMWFGALSLSNLGGLTPWLVWLRPSWSRRPWALWWWCLLGGLTQHQTTSSPADRLQD